MLAASSEHTPGEKMWEVALGDIIGDPSFVCEGCSFLALQG